MLSLSLPSRVPMVARNGPEGVQVAFPQGDDWKELRSGAGGVAGGLAALAALGVHAGAGGAHAVAEAAVALHVRGLALDLAALAGGGALGVFAVAAAVDGGRQGDG